MVDAMVLLSVLQVLVIYPFVRQSLHRICFFPCHGPRLHPWSPHGLDTLGERQGGAVGRFGLDTYAL